MIDKVREAAERVVDDLCARLDSRELYEATTYPVLCITSAASWIEVAGQVVWNTEDENSPPEDDWDNYDSIMKHVENSVETLVTELRELLAPF